MSIPRYLFKFLIQISFITSTFKVISYINSPPYLNSFSKIETYLVNLTNDLNSPHVLACFQET